MNRLRILSATLGLCIVIAVAISFESNADVKSSPTFNKDVAPILYKNCIACHRPGEIAPMSLVSYVNSLSIRADPDAVRRGIACVELMKRTIGVEAVE